jgi:hypothetical protein
LLALLNARDQLDRHSAHQVDARIPAPGPGPVPDGAAMPPPGRDDAGRRRAGRS